MQNVNHLSPTLHFQDAFDGFLDLHPDDPAAAEQDKAAEAGDVSYCRTEWVLAPNSVLLFIAGIAVALSVGVALALWI
jgi:hypothetical protein